MRLSIDEDYKDRISGQRLPLIPETLEANGRQDETFYRVKALVDKSSLETTD